LDTLSKRDDFPVFAGSTNIASDFYSESSIPLNSDSSQMLSSTNGMKEYLMQRSHDFINENEDWTEWID